MAVRAEEDMQDHGSSGRIGAIGNYRRLFRRPVAHSRHGQRHRTAADTSGSLPYLIFFARGITALGSHEGSASRPLTGRLVGGYAPARMWIAKARAQMRLKGRIACSPKLSFSLPTAPIARRRELLLFQGAGGN